MTVVETQLLAWKDPNSTVLVGECVSGLETSIKDLIDQVDRGSVPEDLREVKFVTIPPFYMFRNLLWEEVERKVRVGRRVLLFGEHVIMEIGRLVRGIGEDERFWLMGVATLETYMSCRNGYISLESVWSCIRSRSRVIVWGLVSFLKGRRKKLRSSGLTVCPQIYNWHPSKSSCTIILDNFTSKMTDWGPVFVAVVLFVLLTPGLLIQIPARSRFVAFGSLETSGLSILVHSILYFLLICIFLLAIGVHMYMG
ncbi:hypothetical protein STAS_24619 [Striga asiatica]|uniref:SMAX1-like nucleotide binding domain-containing protein n=1 Tax=Striga asiatica TaxID=4170 RepID=A0A5A7QQ75_STRAF|nr:hypothetical protein STAS_24619 [Striga asiatica]